MKETEYILFYAVFIGFLIFIFSLGAPTFVDEEGLKEIEQIKAPVTITPPSYIENFPCEGWGMFVGICNSLYGLLRVLWNIGISIFFTSKTIVDMIRTLWVLLRFSSAIRWVTLLVITPMTIVLFYIIARLIRGGG